MKDPIRVDRILQKLRRAWLANSEMRLGQLYANLTGHHRDVFFIQDEEVKIALDTLLAEGWHGFSEP